MGRTRAEDPIKAFRYRVFISSFVRAGFSTATGLSRDHAVIAYREGGDNETEQKSPGLTSYPDIVLTRGQIIGAGDDDFFDWADKVHRLGVGGNPGEFREELTIVQYNNDGSEALLWDVTNAWVSKWAPTSDFNASNSENSMESITIVHEGFKRRRPR